MNVKTFCGREDGVLAEVEYCGKIATISMKDLRFTWRCESSSDVSYKIQDAIVSFVYQHGLVFLYDAKSEKIIFKVICPGAISCVVCKDYVVVLTARYLESTEKLIKLSYSTYSLNYEADDVENEDVFQRPKAVYTKNDLYKECIQFNTNYLSVENDQICCSLDNSTISIDSIAASDCKCENFWIYREVGKSLCKLSDDTIFLLESRDEFGICNRKFIYCNDLDFALGCMKYVYIPKILGYIIWAYNEGLQVNDYEYGDFYILSEILNFIGENNVSIPVEANIIIRQILSLCDTAFEETEKERKLTVLKECVEKFNLLIEKINREPFINFVLDKLEICDGLDVTMQHIKSIMQQALSNIDDMISTTGVDTDKETYLMGYIRGVEEFVAKIKYPGINGIDT